MDAITTVRAEDKSPIVEANGVEGSPDNQNMQNVARRVCGAPYRALSMAARMIGRPFLMAGQLLDTAGMHRISGIYNAAGQTYVGLGDMAAREATRIEARDHI